jgi:hypothetical protein
MARLKVILKENTLPWLLAPSMISKTNLTSIKAGNSKEVSDGQKFLNFIQSNYNNKYI